MGAPHGSNRCSLGCPRQRTRCCSAHRSPCASPPAGSSAHLRPPHAAARVTHLRPGKRGAGRSHRPHPLRHARRTSPHRAPRRLRERGGRARSRSARCSGRAARLGAAGGTGEMGEGAQAPAHRSAGAARGAGAGHGVRAVAAKAPKPPAAPAGLGWGARCRAQLHAAMARVAWEGGCQCDRQRGARVGEARGAGVDRNAADASARSVQRGGRKCRSKCAARPGRPWGKRAPAPWEGHTLRRVGAQRVYTVTRAVALRCAAHTHK